MDELGGLLRKLPFIGSALLMAMLAGCGLPGFANFAGEISVMFGAWKGAFGHARWFVLAAAWGGLVIGALYMLRAVRRILHGETKEAWANLVDAGLWRRTPFVLLLAALIVFGFWPRLLADKITPSANGIIRLATGQSDKKVPGRKLATDESPRPAAPAGGKI
jgi:NADH-quinone oxidoreductase subunit M